MREHSIKRYPTVSCCGLDCGLCPRYYTPGSSRCPGCCGPNFYDKHPSCSYITCCVRVKGLEVCGQCNEFPCSKFASWLETGGEYDSFLTPKRAKPNLEFIQKYGLERFVEQQSKRIGLLEEMLKDFDDGRSKSYYCIATTLLLTSDLEISPRKPNKNWKRKELAWVMARLSPRFFRNSSINRPQEIILT